MGNPPVIQKGLFLTMKGNAMTPPRHGGGLRSYRDVRDRAQAYNSGREAPAIGSAQALDCALNLRERKHPLPFLLRVSLPSPLSLATFPV
jgi:hypothetical protein